MLRKKFPIFCLTLSIFLFLYVFFQSEIILDGLNRRFYLVYYKFSGILILFSIITFYLNEKLNQYLMITLFSFVFAIYSFQTYLTIKYGGVTGVRFIEKKIKIYKKETGKDFDFRTQFKIFSELKKDKYKNLKVAVSPNNYKNLDIFPFSSVSNSVILNCNENGYFSLFQSDRYGFNNPDNEWDRKETEYFLIGDSFTFGNCVNRPHDIGSVLRNLSNKSVLNLGYQDTGPLIEYATLREYLRPKTRNIIWLYYEGNDLENLRLELKSEFLKKYIKNLNFKQQLIYKQNEIDNIINKIIDDQYQKSLGSKEIFENKLSFKMKKFLNLWNVRELLIYDSLFEKKFSPPKEFKEIIKHAKNLADKNNSNFYFVYLPSYQKYAGKSDDGRHKFIKKTINDLNITFIDIDKEVFKKEKEPLKLFPFELPGHYTVEGYRKVADVIYKFTKN